MYNVCVANMMACRYFNLHLFQRICNSNPFYYFVKRFLIKNNHSEESNRCETLCTLLVKLNANVLIKRPMCNSIRITAVLHNVNGEKNNSGK